MRIVARPLAMVNQTMEGKRSHANTKLRGFVPEYLGIPADVSRGVTTPLTSFAGTPYYAAEERRAGVKA